MSVQMIAQSNNALDRAQAEKAVVVIRRRRGGSLWTDELRRVVSI